jgi:hypothetical protein
MYSDDYDSAFGSADEYGQGNASSRSNGLATAALVFAILSLLGGMIFYFSVPCAMLAILFALLSRGNGKMFSRCKAAIVLGIVGAVSSIIMTVGTFYLVLTDPTMKSQFEYLFNSYSEEFGLDYDFDDLERLFGIDGSDSYDIPDTSDPIDSDITTGGQFI